MKQTTAKKCLAVALLLTAGVAYPQFNTIRKHASPGYEIMQKNEKDKQTTDIQSDTVGCKIPEISDTLSYETLLMEEIIKAKQGVRKKHLDYYKPDIPSIPSYIPDYETLPELNIINLLAEIRKNGIRHEKIVLAQAILETGWFRSSVCRNKNNLFGLTNPRTGQYYEFSHWTESVKAYYTKVQYRYKEKDGNYLMWLDRIGYAEDPRYVSSLIRILRQYLL